jgi:AcrR family transcriptional regulator
MAERRERILEAAREIVAERGYEGLTIRELAQAAGVTAPTIYNLIGSKDQVLVAAVAELTERFVRGIERAEGDVLPIVDANLRELLRLPRYYRSLLQLMTTAKAAEPARRNVSRAVKDQLRAALGELAEAGGLETWVDLDALAVQLGGVLWSSSLAWAHGWVSDDAFGAQGRLGVSYLMAGVTRGDARDAYLDAIRRAQPRTARAAAEVTTLRAAR